ncbi:MAG: PepSY domain-containing protein [Amaricoccus sp.]
MSPRLLALVPALFLAAPAFAQRLPPAEAKPLSEVIHNVETSLSPRAITDVEWEDDGYWQVNFVNADGRRSRVRIDPMTGETWSRRSR